MPKLNNLYHSVKPYIGLPPKANVTTDADNGTAIDYRALDQFHSGQALIHVGAATGSPSSFSIVYTLEHSTDNSTWVTAPGALSSAHADATVTVTAAGIYQLPFEPDALRRYHRIKRAVTITGGTSPTVPNGAVLLYGDPRRQPV